MANLVRLVFGAIGFVGTLSAIGFVCKFSRDDFLGVRAGSDISQLALTAGGFIVQTVIFGLTACFRHYFWGLAGVCCCVVIWWTLQVIRKRFQQKWADFRIIGLLTLLLILGADLVLVCFPTVWLRNTMVTGLPALPAVNNSGFFTGVTDYYWRCVIDSRRLDNVTSRDPLAKSLGVRNRVDHTSARDRLETAYTVNVLILCFGWWAVFLSRRSRNKADVALRNTCVLVLTVVTVFCPYIFVKLVQPLSMAKLDIVINDRKGGSNKYHGYLVEEQEKSLVILLFEKQESTVVEFPRELIDHIDITNSVDVLAERIAQWDPQENLPIGK